MTGMGATLGRTRDGQPMRASFAQSDVLWYREERTGWGGRLVFHR